MGTPTVEGAAAFAEKDDWPHTKRALPWILAGFLAMVFLVPFDSIRLKLHLPANATPDRLILIAIIVVLIFRTTDRLPRRNRRRFTAVEHAVLIFTGLALLSILLNVGRIYQLNQFTSAEKSFIQLVSYTVFLFVVVATVRGSEIMAFARLILTLACLTAIATLYEAHSGVNVLFLWSSKLLSPIASVAPPLTDIHPEFGRAIIVGPTQHPLALASLFTLALPFAVLPLLEAKRMGQRIVYLSVIGLILAADLSTGEKTAIIAPVVAVATIAVYKRRLLRWAPLALVVLIPVIHVAAPGTLGNVKSVIPTSGSADYSDGRAADYAAVTPDILSNPIIGRGYGTLDSQNWRWYRILDNEDLDVLFMVGLVGLLGYLAIFISALVTAHRVIKAGGVRAPPALAAAAACAGYIVLSATFDAMAYPQSVYAVFFAAGLIVVAASHRTPSVRLMWNRKVHVVRRQSLIGATSLPPHAHVEAGTPGEGSG